MSQRTLSVLTITLLVASLITGIVTADPPTPGEEKNGLTEDELETLWSRDADSPRSQEGGLKRYEENTSAIRQLTNGTDITFKHPPATAATWTRNDFRDLDAGGKEVSIYPPHASLENGRFVQDAHATVFAIHPSTRGHLEPGETPLYIAPHGTIRGFVDYRVQVPERTSFGNRTIEWSLTSHEIEEVRLRNEGESVIEASGSHTPTLDYRIDDSGSTTLTFEAVIHVRLQRTTRIDRGNETYTKVSDRTETIRVSDSIDVEIYDLSTDSYYAEYPDGDSGIAIFQTQPWQGYTLTEDGNETVRGIWRFYTARDTDWDTLVQTSGSGSSVGDSDAIPVYVHAYPSQVGPRSEPVRDGPEIVDTWGTERSSPAKTLGENVDIEVVNRSYSTTHGVAVRTDDVDRSAGRVTGIVRGVEPSLVDTSEGSQRQLRPSNLTLTVLQQTQSNVTLRIELRDEETGEPISLRDDSRHYPIGEDSQSGYITIAEQRVRTNTSGLAIVTVDRSGFVTARFRPGSWIRQNPAYMGDTATSRWHSLGSFDMWFSFAATSGSLIVPFFVMFYAGRRLLRMLAPEDTFQRYS